MALAKQVAALPPTATCKCEQSPEQWTQCACMPLAHVCDAAHFPNRALTACCGDDSVQLCDCSGQALECCLRWCSCCRATQLSRPGRGAPVVGFPGATVTLMTAMAEAGCSRETMALVEEIHKKASAVARDSDVPIDVARGCLQGCVLSPLFFFGFNCGNPPQ